MAAFTSKASGNWGASGQTTWNEVGVPGNGDTVTINAGHTITVNDARTIGTSGGQGTTVITINQSVGTKGVLLITSGGVLTCRGDCLIQSGELRITGTGTFQFDASLAASPSTTAYRIVCRSTGNPARYALLTMEGTNVNNRALITSVKTNNARNGWIDAGDFFSVGVNCSWARWSNLGDVDNFGFDSQSFRTTDFILTDCVLDSTVNRIRTGVHFLSGIFALTRTQYLNNGTFFSQGTIESGIPVVARTITDCSFNGTLDVALRSLELRNVYLGAGINSGLEGQLSVWENVFFYKNDGNGSSTTFPPCPIYSGTFFYYDNPAATNAHYVGMTGITYTTHSYDSWIIQPNVDGTAGDMFFVPNVGATEYQKILTLPNFAGGAGGCFINIGTAPNVKVEFCTYHVGAVQDGVATAETGDTQPGTITALRSNIGYRIVSGTGALFDRSNTFSGRTDISVPSNTGWNALVNVTGAPAGRGNTTYPAYVGIQTPAVFSVAPTASTTDISFTGNPFVDSSRDIRTYAVARGLASIGDSDTTKANAVRSALTAVPNPGDANYNASVSISDLIQWVREGWAVKLINTSFTGSHNGAWMGAVQTPPYTLQFTERATQSISEWAAPFRLTSSNTQSNATVNARVVNGRINLSGTTTASMSSGTVEFTNLVLTSPRGAPGVVEFSAPNHLSVTGNLTVNPRFKFNGIFKNAIIRTSPGRRILQQHSFTAPDGTTVNGLVGEVGGALSLVGTGNATVINNAVVFANHTNLRAITSPIGVPDYTARTGLIWLSSTSSNTGRLETRRNGTSHYRLLIGPPMGNVSLFYFDGTDTIQLGSGFFHIPVAGQVYTYELVHAGNTHTVLRDGVPIIGPLQHVGNAGTEGVAILLEGGQSTDTELYRFDSLEVFR
jgi:hypothetical protein